MNKKLLISVFIGICLFNTSPSQAFIGHKIRTYEILEQPLDKEIITDIGSPILRITKKKDLPNVFGRADIWGGKVNTGYKDLTYLGINPDGTIKLRINDITIVSDETVMTRYGVSKSYVNVNSYSSGNYGSMNGTVTHVDKRDANRDILSSGCQDISFNYKENPQLEFANKLIKIISVSPLNLHYIIIEKSPSNNL